MRVTFFRENFQAFKRVFGPLFFLVVITNSLDQYLNLQVENALQDMSGAQQQVYFYGFLSIISSVIAPVLLSLAVLFAFSNKAESDFKMNHFFSKYFKQTMIETLRAWGKTLLWALLLVIPGLVRFLQYLFVPFVVAFSADYNSGKVDALSASQKVFSKNWGKVLSIWLGFHIFIPLVLTSLFDSYSLIWKTPIASLALSMVDTYILIISTQLLFNIFKKEVTPHATTDV
jgi:hypothetical protein